jgi:DNA-binding SARP family transcriptional activator
MTQGSVTQLTPGLRLLGGWQLTTSTPVVGVVGNNARRLVSLLALRGAMSRAQIASTLWPDADEDPGARLRTVLWRLKNGRQLLQEVDGHIALSDDITVDVHEMRTVALALTGDPASSTIDDPPTTTFEADLLPTWYDDWLVIDRERIRQLRLHALEALAVRRLNAGNYAAALDAGLAAVRAEPLRESAHRCVIDTHLAEGNLVEARRQFDSCRAILARELRIAPSASLVDRMRTALV